MSEYLTIKYKNSCDLAGSIFTSSANTFWYSLFLPVDLANSTYELTDEGREDGDKNVINDFRKLQKRYSFTIVVPEYIYESLCFVQIHDTIHITTRGGEYARVYNFNVQLGEWRDNSVSVITVTFTADYTINYGCCSNTLEVPNQCITCNTKLKITGWIDKTNDIFTDPLNNGVGDKWYYFVGEYSGNEIIKNSLYYYSYRHNGWVLYAPKSGEAACWANGGISYKMYSDGIYWYPYQKVKSAVNDGSNIVVNGYVAPDCFIQLQISPDGSTWSNQGTVMNGDVFQNAGAVISGLTPGNVYYFRFYLYNNNCNYGYSDSYRIVKS